MVEYSEFVCTITFNRLLNKNSINEAFLDELNNVFNEVEQKPLCQIILLQGQQGIFCTGMDFNEMTKRASTESVFSTLYMETLKRMTLMPRIVIAKVDGQVMAVGVGIVAACDLVVATTRSQFSLSEALWGLLPACVTPYLIRRVGFQNAYRMTLTTLSIDAQKAYHMNLVDELDDSPERIIRQLILRLTRLENSTIGNLKQYFRKMWMITDVLEETAISEISRLTESPEVQNNIQRFIKYNRFPWDKDSCKGSLS